jgi:hypothetical protein
MLAQNFDTSYSGGKGRRIAIGGHSSKVSATSYHKNKLKKSKGLEAWLK